MRTNPVFQLKSGGLIDCNKCNLFRTSDSIDAISRKTEFNCIDSRSEFLFRTYSVATSPVTSLTLF